MSASETRPDGVPGPLSEISELPEPAGASRPPKPPGHRNRAARIDRLVAQLASEIDAGLGDGAIAALDPATARTLVSAAARAYASATEEGAEPPSNIDLTPTDAVVLATAVLRAHDLNPFDLALWFSRSAP